MLQQEAKILPMKLATSQEMGNLEFKFLHREECLTTWEFSQAAETSTTNTGI